MIDRQYSGIIFECDGCSETLETSQTDWDQAMVRFRAQRWRAEKVGSDWVHLCPACQRGIPR